jgi:hypothetical protein
MQKEGIKNVLTDDMVDRLVASQMTLQDFLEGYLGKE